MVRRSPIGPYHFPMFDNDFLKIFFSKLLETQMFPIVLNHSGNVAHLPPTAYTIPVGGSIRYGSKGLPNRTVGTGHASSRSHHVDNVASRSFPLLKQKWDGHYVHVNSAAALSLDPTYELQHHGSSKGGDPSYTRIHFCLILMFVDYISNVRWGGCPALNCTPWSTCVASVK